LSVAQKTIHLLKIFDFVWSSSRYYGKSWRGIFMTCGRRERSYRWMIMQYWQSHSGCVWRIQHAICLVYFSPSSTIL
jgi:hypothetical protein